MVEAGVGMYLLEIERVERMLQKTPRVVQRFLTPAEQRFCKGSLRPAARYAGCLAARGAVYRALQLDARSACSRWDVTLSFDDRGSPQVVLAGAALAAAGRAGVDEVALSLSYTEQVAVANAMALTAAVRPAPKQEPDDERVRIARSFREVRSVLDELERVQEDDLKPTVGAISAAGSAAVAADAKLDANLEVEHEAGIEH